MLSAMSDYQTDNRGDVGSWVREAAIGSLLPMLLLATAHTEAEMAEARRAAAAEEEEVAAARAARLEEVAAERKALDAALPSLCERFVEALTQQANEKIDRLREHACLTLTQAIKAEKLPAVPHRETLAAVLVDADDGAAGGSAAEVRDEEGGMPFMPTSDYLAPHTCFPRTVRFLGCARYRRAALQGLCISAGGVTESTMKAACGSLMDHVRSLDGERKLVLVEDLISLLIEHEKTPRVCLPLLRTLQHLPSRRRSRRRLPPTPPPPPPPPLSPRASSVCTHSRSKDVPTLIVALALLLLLLLHSGGQTRTEVVRTLVLLLGHRFPRFEGHRRPAVRVPDHVWRPRRARAHAPRGRAPAQRGRRGSGGRGAAHRRGGRR